MFGKSMEKLLIGAALGAGTSYIKDEVFKGSFLETTLKDVGKNVGADKFFNSAAGDVATNIGGRFVSATVKEMLGQGLGVDPRDVKTMPEIRIPEGDTFRSKALQKPNNYNGFPQGSKKILENAFQDSVVEDIAMKYTQSRVPDVKVAGLTIRTGGIKDLEALAKGQIQSLKS